MKVIDAALTLNTKLRVPRGYFDALGGLLSNYPLWIATAGKARIR